MNVRRHMTARNWAAALLCSFSALGGPWAGLQASGQPPTSENKKAGESEAEALMHKTADFYKKVGSLAVEIERAQKLGPMTIKNTLSIDFVRPNKLAVRTQGIVPGVDVVSDGKTISVSVGALKRYTQSTAPASLDDLGADPISKGIIMSSLQGTMLGELVSTDPYAMLMTRVKTSTYAGKEPLDGGTTHHLLFTQDQFDWEIWIAADGDPLIRKVVMDMTKSLAGNPTAAQFKGQKLEMTQTFKGWKVDAAPRVDAFVFQPPAGSSKVDSLMEAFGGGGGGNAEPPSPLVGKPAPAVALKRLDEGEFRLADHRNKDVVMLDFWATWCGPCVTELPILSEVANAYKDKGVAFFAINLRETPAQIKKFQEDKKLKFNVALDPEGKTGIDYGANAIPMLVLVDKSGVVRSVHVGYNPSIKTTLSKELDALVAGKDIPKNDVPAAAVATAKAPALKAEGLERLWSANGAYTGVATDAKGVTIYALERGGKCYVLDSRGKTTRSFAMGGAANGALRVARRAGGGDGLLAFRMWGPSVLAVMEDGTQIWEETGGQGVDDVWPADLDGDGNDEAIVGYNGGTGLHVFSLEGKRLWSRTDMGNVWHVTAGDLDGDGKPEVITTSAQGKVKLRPIGVCWFTSPRIL
jgi:peroxiredoxin